MAHPSEVRDVVLSVQRCAALAGVGPLSFLSLSSLLFCGQAFAKCPLLLQMRQGGLWADTVLKLRILLALGRP